MREIITHLLNSFAERKLQRTPQLASGAANCVGYFERSCMLLVANFNVKNAEFAFKHKNRYHV